MKNNTNRGFTIVELAVVIVVIAILATLTTVVYVGVRENAKAAAIADGLDKIEEGLRLWHVNEGQHTWRRDSTLGGGGNPQVSWMIESTTLGQYLKEVPRALGDNVAYDFDGDPMPNGSSVKGCNSYHWNGPNLIIGSIEESIRERVSEIVDGDDQLGCGKFRSVTTATTAYKMGDTVEL